MDTGLGRKSFGSELLQVLRGNVRQYIMLGALAVIWIIFTIITDMTFLTPRNLSILSVQMCVTGILTGGMLLVMVSGNIDLSAGSVCGTLGMVAAYVMTRINFLKDLNPIVKIIIAIVVTIIAGLLIGAWHGFWVAHRRVPAFIVTLASQIAFTGLTLLISGGATIGEFDSAFSMIGQGYIPAWFGELKLFNQKFHVLTLIIFAAAIAVFVLMEFSKRKKRIANGFTVLSLPLQISKTVMISIALGAAGFVFAAYRGMPYAILILLAVVAFSNVTTTRTSFGRHVYAIGGNMEAARLSGVNIKKSLMKVFIIMGAMCSVAAIVSTSRLNAAHTAAGKGFELNAIAACIIGGTSTSGGSGTAIGAIIGALVMESLDNGMSLMNWDVKIQYIVKGAILLLAVWVDSANRNKK